MGKLMVIEGLDGSGKATQAQMLEESLNARGVAAFAMSFPNYKSNSSALVHMYLDGEFGEKAGDVNPYAASLFYSVDRFASFARGPLRERYQSGDLILCDRYTTSNIIHQCSKLPREEWPGFVRWLEDTEYGRLGIPAPDLVVFLDVEAEVSQALLQKRYGSHGGADIHERDLDYLLRCREVAHWCVENLGWQQITCSAGGVMREKEDIAAELLEIMSSL